MKGLFMAVQVVVAVAFWVFLIAWIMYVAYATMLMSGGA